MTRRLLPVLAAALLGWAPFVACKRSEPIAADRGDGTIPVVRATRVSAGSIHIDGRTDEPAWEHAGQTGAFVQVGDGHPATNSRVPATARIAWDDTNLYVAVEVAERGPTTPFHHDDVDPHLWERASAVEMMIQPGDLGDNKDYYEIQVDTVGAVWDTHFDDYNRPVWQEPNGEMHFGHQEWDAHLQRAATVDNAGGSYTVEMALPWSSIQGARVPVPPHEGDTWRLNLYSFRDGQRDALAWSPILGKGNFHFASRWGRVVFAGP
jgi:hypothetical protein